MAKKKSWKEKLADSKDLPKVIDLGSKSARWGGDTCAIPAPKDVDAIMKKVPKGKLITINEMRKLIAKQQGADVGCPITTGIFAWIAAHAAEESAEEGAKRITPYWRTLKAGGEINPKYPGGPDKIQKMLEAEGHCVIKKGKRYLVTNFEKALVKLARD